MASPRAKRTSIGRFARGGALHILDFGLFEMDPRGGAAEAGSGKLWRLHPASEAR